MEEKETPINEYRVNVMVQYSYTVEAESYDEAMKEGWNYDDYRFTGFVDSIEVQLENEDIYGEEPEEEE
jgi:hypothetical protein